MTKIKKLLTVLVMFLGVTSVNSYACDNRKDRGDYSISVYLGSAHLNMKPGDIVNETNPGLGMSKNLGCGFLGADYSLSVSTLRNTMGGRTGALSLDADWLFPVNNGYHIILGGSISYLDYENPRNVSSYTGIAFIPFFGIGKGEWSLRVAILSSDPFAALGGNGQAAFLFWLQHDF